MAAANRGMEKKYSALLIIRGRKIKTTMVYHLTSVTMTTIKRMKDRKCWWRCEVKLYVKKDFNRKKSKAWESQREVGWCCAGGIKDRGRGYKPRKQAGRKAGKAFLTGVSRRKSAQLLPDSSSMRTLNTWFMFFQTPTFVIICYSNNWKLTHCLTNVFECENTEIEQQKNFPASNIFECLLCGRHFLSIKLFTPQRSSVRHIVMHTSIFNVHWWRRKQAVN